MKIRGRVIEARPLADVEMNDPTMITHSHFVTELSEVPKRFEITLVPVWPERPDARNVTRLVIELSEL